MFTVRRAFSIFGQRSPSLTPNLRSPSGMTFGKLSSRPKSDLIPKASMLAVNVFLKDTYNVNFSPEAATFFINQTNSATQLLDRFADPQNNLMRYKMNLKEEHLNEFFQSIKDSAEISSSDVGNTFYAVDNFFDMLEEELKNPLFLEQRNFDDLWNRACEAMANSQIKDNPGYGFGSYS